MKIKTALFALLVGGLMLITSISFVYAFVQQAEAERQKSLAMELSKSVIECEKHGHEIKFKLNREVDSLNDALDSLVHRIRLLEEQAAKSKNKK